MTRFPGRYTISFALFILIVSILPTSDHEELGSVPYRDKLAHIFLYAILAFVASGEVKRSDRERKPPMSSYLVMVLYTLFYGIFIEMVQLLLSYRSFEVMDILANSIGIFGGVAMFFIFYHNRVAENK